jgi:Fe-S cluster assembly protein SufD
MNRLAEQFARELTDQAGAARHSDQPAWLAGLRERGLQRFRASGLPDKDVERWKYTSLFALEERSPRLARADAGLAGQPAPAALLPDAPRVLMQDGAWAGLAGALPPGVSVMPLAEALSDESLPLRELLQELDDEDRAAGLAALNTAALGDGMVVHVAAGADAGQVQVQWVASPPAAELMANARACVILEDGARLELVEQFQSSGGVASQLNLVTQIRLGERASCRHTRLQQESDEGILVTRTDVGQAADSEYHYAGLDFGGALVRHDLRARLQATGASCRLSGACLTRGSSHVDNHLDAEHLAPGCSSEQWFRAVLNDRSRVVFNGRVYVAAGADGTDARQSSAGLLLSPRAEIDSKPELEIYADEVVASHGATVGQLDEQQLFYLRSRGLGRDAARNMLTVAFCRSVIDSLPEGDLRQARESRLQSSLEAAGMGDG